LGVGVVSKEVDRRCSLHNFKFRLRRVVRIKGGKMAVKNLFVGKTQKLRQRKKRKL